MDKPIVLSIHRVPESKLNRWRRLDLRTREEADIRAHERFIRSESNLRDAIIRYLRGGGTAKLISEMAESLEPYYGTRQP